MTGRRKKGLSSAGRTERGDLDGLGNRETAIASKIQRDGVESSSALSLFHNKLPPPPPPFSSPYAYYFIELRWVSRKFGIAGRVCATAKTSVNKGLFSAAPFSVLCKRCRLLKTPAAARKSLQSLQRTVPVVHNSTYSISPPAPPVFVSAYLHSPISRGPYQPTAYRTLKGSDCVASSRGHFIFELKLQPHL